MKIYPKVPHQGHLIDDEDFAEVDIGLWEADIEVFEADDLRVFEKVDGGNFRFALYDERFDHTYGERVAQLNPSDGDIVFGMKRSVRGIIDSPLESFDGNLRRAVQFLRERVDPDDIRTLHDECGPLVWFSENMVRHSLDYDYTESPPPPLIGFDVYAPEQDPRDRIPSNPMEERFEGFLSTEDAKRAFEKIGIPFAREHNVEDLDITAIRKQEDDAFPESNYADVRVEGFVFRSDSLDHRVKVVREEFKEINREAFGPTEDGAETGEELIVAAFCPPARIRKIVRKMVVDEGRDFGLHLNEDLRRRVYDDIWAENWREIKEIDEAFNPCAVKPLVAKRCITELRKMKTNAELNDAPPEELWRDFGA